MLTANATIATLKALPATSPNLDKGGNDGAGKLCTIISYCVHLSQNTVLNMSYNRQQPTDKPL